MTEKLKFEDFVVINGQEITKKYVQSLSYEEREVLIEPIFDVFRATGFLYPDAEENLDKEYKRIVDYVSPINENTIYNNSSVGTSICKYFCNSFYQTTDKKNKTMEEIFNDDALLRRLIKNRLGMDWLISDKKGPGVNEAFNFRYKMIIQGMRSMRLITQTSMFKPICAKWIVEKYSEPGDLVGDYSAGFGGRLLGTMAAGRKYVGTDPLTVDDLEKMADYFKFDKSNYKLIKSGSEDYVGEENSVDLYWSSPPYFDQEIYSKDESQAYNKGESYFYDVYWKKTLENVKFMLKPEKVFGLNVTNYPKMVDMAKEAFGEPVEIINLRNIRSHLTKTAGTEKLEPVYIFRNNK